MLTHFTSRHVMSYHTMSYHITPYHIISYHLLSQAVLQTHRALYAARQKGGEDPTKSNNTRYSNSTERESDGDKPCVDQSVGSGSGLGPGSGLGSGLSPGQGLTIVFYCFEYGNAWWGQWGPSNVKPGGKTLLLHITLIDYTLYGGDRTKPTKN